MRKHKFDDEYDNEEHFVKNSDDEKVHGKKLLEIEYTYREARIGWGFWTNIVLNLLIVLIVSLNLTYVFMHWVFNWIFVVILFFLNLIYFINAKVKAKCVITTEGLSIGPKKAVGRDFLWDEISYYELDKGIMYFTVKDKKVRHRFPVKIHKIKVVEFFEKYVGKEEK